MGGVFFLRRDVVRYMFFSMRFGGIVFLRKLWFLTSFIINSKVWFLEEFVGFLVNCVRGVRRDV